MTYEATTEAITVVDGVEVDITVRGDEDKAEKTMMELREHTGRIGEAFATETPPLALDEVSSDRQPLMTVAWDRLFEEDGDD